MKYTYDGNSSKLNIFLDEDIDMGSCRTLRTIIDGYIMKYSPIECELDMSKVNFMDSSGIGFIMGRYNLLNMLGSKLIVQGTDGSIKKVINMANIGDKIKVV
jgi:stage II sporulation protein AA (anti-sigma F factor antagonist)